MDNDIHHCVIYMSGEGVQFTEARGGAPYRAVAKQCDSPEFLCVYYGGVYVDASTIGELITVQSFAIVPPLEHTPVKELHVSYPSRDRSDGGRAVAMQAKKYCYTLASKMALL